MSSSKLWSYETLSHAVAGAAGGVTAMTIFYPLDTVRSRLQAEGTGLIMSLRGQPPAIVLCRHERLVMEKDLEDKRAANNTFVVMKDLADTEGLLTLYRGLQPVLESLCCSNFVYFYTFHGLRSVVHSKSRGRKAAVDLLMSSIAGVINVLITTPLWVANSRMKMQGAKLLAGDDAELKKHPRYNNLLATIYRMRTELILAPKKDSESIVNVTNGIQLLVIFKNKDAMIKICRTEGWQALWSSLVPSLMLVVNPAIQFTVYETLKAETMKLLGAKELNAATYFLLGAISKSVSTILTYPLQLVQSKLRYGSDKLKSMNIIQVFLYIIRAQGFGGLYKGLEAKLLQTVLTAALMFLCYEKIVAFVLHLMKAKRE